MGPEGPARPLVASWLRDNYARESTLAGFKNYIALHKANTWHIFLIYALGFWW